MMWFVGEWEMVDIWAVRSACAAVRSEGRDAFLARLAAIPSKRMAMLKHVADAMKATDMDCQDWHEDVLLELAEVAINACDSFHPKDNNHGGDMAYEVKSSPQAIELAENALAMCWTTGQKMGDLCALMQTALETAFAQGAEAMRNKLSRELQWHERTILREIRSLSTPKMEDANG